MPQIMGFRGSLLHQSSEGLTKYKCAVQKLILFSVQYSINNPVKAGEGLDLCG